jgi:hypothetical protein
VGGLLALTDNPLLTLGIFVRRAGGLLAPSGDDPAAALRWIELFGLSSAPWPRELWPGVTRLIPSLHSIAGRAEAIPLALGVVFGLPVAGVRVAASSVEHAASTTLGGSHARLGVDTVLAGEALDGSSLEIHVGPVTLDVYLDHENRRAQREAVYRLVLPVHLARVQERWTVGDPLAGSRVGEGGEPSILGINSRLAGAA